MSYFEYLDPELNKYIKYMDLIVEFRKERLLDSITKLCNANGFSGVYDIDSSMKTYRPCPIGQGCNMRICVKVSYI